MKLNMRDVLNPMAEAWHQAGYRTDLARYMVETCRLALVNDNTETCTEDRAHRVATVLLAVEQLLDMAADGIEDLERVGQVGPYRREGQGGGCADGHRVMPLS